MLRRAFLFFVVLCLALFFPVNSQAATVERVQLRDFGAFAEWQYENAQGGVTFVSVVVSEIALKPGTGNCGCITGILAVGILSVDANGDIVFSGSGGTEEFSFTISTGLGSGHVEGTIPVLNEGTAEEVLFTVNLSWESTGDAQVTHSTEVFHEDGFRAVSIFHGLRRDAVATGSVFGVGAEWTPIPSTTAFIMRNQSGSISITATQP